MAETLFSSLLFSLGFSLFSLIEQEKEEKFPLFVLLAGFDIHAWGSFHNILNFLGSIWVSL
jgi:hypothetical protein